MVFPNYPNKHLKEALFHPDDFVAYRKFKKSDFPKDYIIIYQSSTLRYFRKKYAGKYDLIKLHTGFCVHKLKNKNI